jgi:hypothetical protein
MSIVHEFDTAFLVQGVKRREIDRHAAVTDASSEYDWTAFDPELAINRNPMLVSPEPE